MPEINKDEAVGESGCCLNPYSMVVAPESTSALPAFPPLPRPRGAIDYREDLTRVLTLQPVELTPEQQRSRMTTAYLLLVVLAIDCVLLPAVLGVTAKTIPLLLGIIIPFALFVAWFFWRERAAMKQTTTIRIAPEGISIGLGDRSGRTTRLRKIKSIGVARVPTTDAPVVEVRTRSSVAHVGQGRSEEELLWIAAWMNAAVEEARHSVESIAAF